MNPNIQWNFQICISVPLNKTQALKKSLNMDIWSFGRLNQLFIKGSYTETKFSKK